MQDSVFERAVFGEDYSTELYNETNPNIDLTLSDKIFGIIGVEVGDMSRVMRDPSIKDAYS
jgi:hypothetical protein